MPHMLHVVNVRPVYVYERAEGESLNTRRTVAYRAVCSCGWKSGSKPRHLDARQLGRLHRDAGG